MAIGSRQFQGLPQQGQNPQTVSGQFGEGISAALSNLGSAVSANEDAKAALRAAMKGEEERQQRFDASNAWTKLQGQMSREQIDALNAAPQNGAGLTNSRYDTLKAQQETFLSSIKDPKLREEFRVETEGYLQNLTTATYGEEFKLRTQYESTEVTNTVSSLTSEVASGRTSMEAAQAQLDEVLSTTRLSEAYRASMKEAARVELAAAQFRYSTQTVASGRGTVREADGSDVVAAGLMPWERGFLNATSKRESGGAYNVRYNGAQGATFDDYSDHPRVFVPGPDGMSSAAGRYMITATTWDDLVERYGRGVLPDFSPESQDRAALLLARERFNAQIDPGGWDFDAIMSRGTDEQVLGVKRALSGTWKAFEGMSDAEFLAIFRGKDGVAGGGTGVGNIPDPFTDPRYSDLTFDAKVALANQAQQTVSSMQEALKAQQQATADMLKAQFNAGVIDSSQVMAAINSGKVTPADSAVLTGMVKEDLSQQKEAARFAAAADSGTILGATNENKAAAYQFYRRSGVVAGLQNNDPAAVAKLGYGFAQTGVMPEEISSILQGMAASPNQAQASFAMDTLANLRAKNPDMFAFAMPDNLVSLEGAYSVMKRYSPPGSQGEILERLTTLRSPEMAQQRKALEKDINDQLVTFTADRIADNFDDGLFDFGAAPPISAAARTQLKADFDSLYQEYYPAFRNEGQTAEFVIGQMRNSWTRDSTGGTSRLMYLGPSAPASGYAPINGSYDWVRSDIVSGLGLAPDAEFGLVADGQSEGDIASGRPASYLVVVPTENGSSIMFDPENPGQPQRIRPTPTAAAVREEQKRQKIEALLGERQGILEDKLLITDPAASARVAEIENMIRELRGEN